MAETLITDVEHIITEDMVTGDMITNNEDTPSENPIREKLKKAGKIVVSGLLVGGAVASLASGFGTFTGGLAQMALTALSSASTIAETGMKIAGLINKEPELEGV